MTRGVVPIRTLDIAEVRPVPLRDHLLRSLDELSARDVKRRVELLQQALDGRDRVMAQRLAWEIRALDDTNALAKKTARGDLAAFRQKHRLLLDGEAMRAARRIVQLPSPAVRKQAASAAKNGGLDLPAGLIERAASSFWRPRGVLRDVPTRRSDDFPGGRYTLFVPEDLDPLEPRPLLLALHGGGIHTVKGKTVRGSGAELMPVFEETARRLGWFVCCPTAIEAPWSANANLAWLRAVLEDVATRWNVDQTRIHLFGLSGGGEGAWMFATRANIDFASVGVASGDAPTGVSSITGRKIALWLYHSDGDEIFPVEPVRKVAERLRKSSSVDFVYCELPKEPHGMPPAATRDWIRYVEPKRAVRTKSLWPKASFAEPLSSTAIRLWGDPTTQWSDTPIEPEDALARMRRGGFDAEIAATALAGVEPTGSTAPGGLRPTARRQGLDGGAPGRRPCARSVGRRGRHCPAGRHVAARQGSGRSGCLCAGGGSRGIQGLRGGSALGVG